MLVKGVAIKSGVYSTDDGRMLRIRDEDLDDMADALVGADFVSSVDHQNPSKLGVVVEARRVDNGIEFVADVDSHEVSVGMSVTDLTPIDGDFVDGQPVFYGSGWGFAHLSLVGEGRCGVEMGCGVDAVNLTVTTTISNSDVSVPCNGSEIFIDVGENMDSVKDESISLSDVEELKGQVDALKQELETVGAELSSVRAERDDLMANIEAIREEEFKGALAEFSTKYPDVDVSEVKTMEALVMLSKAVDQAVDGVKVQLSKHEDEDVKKPSKLDELLAKRDALNRGV